MVAASDHRRNLGQDGKRGAFVVNLQRVQDSTMVVTDVSWIICPENATTDGLICSSP